MNSILTRGIIAMAVAVCAGLAAGPAGAVPSYVATALGAPGGPLTYHSKP